MDNTKTKLKQSDEEAKKKRKKILIPVISVLGAAAIAGAAVGIYFAVKGNSTPKSVDVLVPYTEDQGVTFTNKEAFKGQEYKTQIKVDTSKTGGKVLPEELTSVECGSTTIKAGEYTYVPADDFKSANFEIPGAYVKGGFISIDFELKNPPAPPVDDSLLKIEYEYHNNVAGEDDTVGFVFVANEASKITFDWGDGEPADEVTASTDPMHAIAATQPDITHTYMTAGTHTITVKGNLAIFMASYMDNNMIKKGNLYFQNVKLNKDFEKTKVGGEDAFLCKLGGISDATFSELNAATFGDNVTEIPDMFVAYTCIDEVSIPDTITAIGTSAFDTCQELNNVMFGEHPVLKTIGNSAFAKDNKLYTFTIPNTVTKISEAAFSDSYEFLNFNLHTFNNDDPVPEIEYHAFPESSYFVTNSDEVSNNFKTAESWKTYIDALDNYVVKGASVIYEDASDENATFYQYNSGGLAWNSSSTPKFYINGVETTDNLKVVNNLGNPVSIETYAGDPAGFQIPASEYEEGLIWVKVTYEPAA